MSPRAAADGTHYEWRLYDKSANEYDESNVISLPSVTTIIHATLASPALVPWAYRTTVEGVGHLLDAYPDETTIDELQNYDLDELLKENKLRPDDIRDAGASRGTDAHAYLEYLAGLPHAEALEVAEDYVKHGDDAFRLAICKWWCVARPIVVASEARLKSLRYGFAGTVDLVWKQGKNLGPGITDLKTRKANSSSYRDDEAQIAGYTIMWNEENPDNQARWGSVLIAMDDGNFAENSARCSPETFISIKNVFDTLKGRG